MFMCGRLKKTGHGHLKGCVTEYRTLEHFQGPQGKFVFWKEEHVTIEMVLLVLFVKIVKVKLLGFDYVYT